MTLAYVRSDCSQQPEKIYGLEGFGLEVVEKGADPNPGERPQRAVLKTKKTSSDTSSRRWRG